VTTAETGASLLFQNELMLFDTGEVAFHSAELHSASLLETSRKPFWLIV
jgi:hypothetical protein